MKFVNKLVSTFPQIPVMMSNKKRVERDVKHLSGKQSVQPGFNVNKDDVLYSVTTSVICSVLLIWYRIHF